MWALFIGFFWLSTIKKEQRLDSQKNPFMKRAHLTLEGMVKSRSWGAMTDSSLSFLPKLMIHFIKITNCKDNRINSFWKSIILFILLIKSHLQSYPCPLQINSFWNLGFLLAITIILQIITGIFLALHYWPNVCFLHIIPSLPSVNTDP